MFQFNPILASFFAGSFHPFQPPSWLIFSLWYPLPDWLNRSLYPVHAAQGTWIHSQDSSAKAAIVRATTPAVLFQNQLGCLGTGQAP